MNWQFWQKSPDLKLTNRLRITLRSQFKMDDQTLDQLRYVSKSGQYSGRRVRNILIFDPRHVTSGEIKSYQDAKNYRQAVLFEGHVDNRNNYVYLSERRPEDKTAKTGKAAVVASSRQRPQNS